MSNPDSIEEGDIVNVHFENVQSLFGVKVIGIPYATGDTWKLKQIDGSNDIYYVQQFTLMKLIKKGEKPE